MHTIWSDFVKVFETVDHNMLLSLSQRYDPRLWRWVILGPLLFLFFIATCLCLVNAEDIKLFSAKSLPLGSVYLQSILYALVCWCSSNGLALNVGNVYVYAVKSSSTSFSYSFGGYSLSNQNCTQVTFDNTTLIWSTPLTFFKFPVWSIPKYCFVI